MDTLSRFRPDGFTMTMLATVGSALLLPCRGATAGLFESVTGLAIALLFFLQGAQLSRAAIVVGAFHWRLHLVVFAATFVLFPIVGLALRPLSGNVLTQPLYLGLLFLCTLPSTVQASVAFTSIAGGNVPAAMCSATLSSLIGAVLTPVLVAVFASAQGHAPTATGSSSPLRQRPSASGPSPRPTATRPGSPPTRTPTGRRRWPRPSGSRRGWPLTRKRTGRRRRPIWSMIFFAIVIASVGIRAYRDLSQPAAWAYWKESYFAPTMTSSVVAKIDLGDRGPGQPWRVGIGDPLRPGSLALVVTGQDFAVATSGVAERGAHIVNPHTGQPAVGLASLTVVGARLAATDAYATAAFAMGPAAQDWVESLDGYEAFAVTAGGQVWQTSGFRAHLASA